MISKVYIFNYKEFLRWYAWIIPFRITLAISIIKFNLIGLLVNNSKLSEESTIPIIEALPTLWRVLPTPFPGWIG